MARRALGPASLAVAQAVTSSLADVDGPCVVAVSGGADSLALAAGAAWAAARLPVVPTAVVVDHGLQPGSGEVAEEAARACRGLGLAAVVESVRVVVGGDGPEADARAARYAALESHAGPILLGHTRDDQAETVLLGLLRGSGTRSLAGMAPVAGRLLRPLLGLSRAATAAACAELGLEPWQDPHNDDPRYARVRARRLLGSLTAELGPGVVDNLARTARLARADADALDAVTPTLAAEPAAEELAGLPVALRSRALLAWLRARGASELTAAHVDAVDDLLTAWRGQGPLDLPGVRVERKAGRLRAFPR